MLVLLYPPFLGYHHSMQLSRVQNDIISRLKNASVLRHGKLKPANTSSDLYNYHLKFLQQKGLVEKTESGYQLSNAGKRYVADAHHTSDQAQRLFKINVITILSRISNTGVEILVQRRTANPSFGKVGVPGGTIIKGEDLLDGATRKLEQETGLSAPFRLIGFERRRWYNDEKLLSDVLFPICHATDYSGELTDTEYGENFWVSIDDAIRNETNPHDSIVSINNVLDAIKNNRLHSLGMFYEETSQIADTNDW